MIKQIIQVSMCLAGLALLTSCNQKPVIDHAYLMKHPAILENELERCKKITVADSACEMAREAGHDFFVLINKRQEDPEAFGKVILRDQLMIASSQRVSPSQREQVEELLAAVAATSAE